MRSLYSVIDVIKYLHKDNDLTIHFITSTLSGSESILCTLAGKFASHFLCLINLPPSSTNLEKSLLVVDMLLCMCCFCGGVDHVACSDVIMVHHGLVPPILAPHKVDAIGIKVS